MQHCSTEDDGGKSGGGRRRRIWALDAAVQAVQLFLSQGRHRLLDASECADAVLSGYRKQHVFTEAEFSVVRACASGISRYENVCVDAWRGFCDTDCSSVRDYYMLLVIGYLVLFRFHEMGHSGLCFLLREQLQGSLTVRDFLRFLANEKAIAEFAVPHWHKHYDANFVRQTLVGTLQDIRSGLAQLLMECCGDAVDMSKDFSATMRSSALCGTVPPVDATAEADDAPPPQCSSVTRHGVRNARRQRSKGRGVDAGAAEPIASHAPVLPATNDAGTTAGTHSLPGVRPPDADVSSSARPALRNKFGVQRGSPSVLPSAPGPSLGASAASADRRIVSLAADTLPQGCDSVEDGRAVGRWTTGCASALTRCVESEGSSAAAHGRVRPTKTSLLREAVALSGVDVSYLPANHAATAMHSPTVASGGADHDEWNVSAQRQIAAARAEREKHAATLRESIRRAAHEARQKRARFLADRHDAVQEARRRDQQDLRERETVMKTERRQLSRMAQQRRAFEVECEVMAAKLERGDEIRRERQELKMIRREHLAGIRARHETSEEHEEQPRFRTGAVRPDAAWFSYTSPAMPGSSDELSPVDWKAVARANKQKRMEELRALTQRRRIDKLHTEMTLGVLSMACEATREDRRRRHEAWQQRMLAMEADAEARRQAESDEKMLALADHVRQKRAESRQKNEALREEARQRNNTTAFLGNNAAAVERRRWQQMEEGFANRLLADQVPTRSSRPMHGS